MARLQDVIRPWRFYWLPTRPFEPRIGMAEPLSRSAVMTK
jgi:hypothetical protein